MAKKLTEDMFKVRATSKFGVLYDYSNSKIDGVDTPITIICPIHGEFAQTPYQHLKSVTGCPKCSIKKTAESKQSNLQEFIDKANKVHKGKYSYENSVYLSAKEKITITCPNHGDFDQLVSGHLSGYGCSKCTNYGKGRVAMDKPCTLYYINIKGTSLYKIGITSVGIKQRYRTAFDRDQIDVVFSKDFETGQEAYDIEQSYVKQFAHLRYDGDKVLSSGHTEMFVEDIFKGNYSVYTD